VKYLTSTVLGHVRAGVWRVSELGKHLSYTVCVWWRQYRRQTSMTATDRNYMTIA